MHGFERLTVISFPAEFGEVEVMDWKRGSGYGATAPGGHRGQQLLRPGAGDGGGVGPLLPRPVHYCDGASLSFVPRLVRLGGASKVGAPRVEVVTKGPAFP